MHFKTLFLYSDIKTTFLKPNALFFIIEYLGYYLQRFRPYCRYDSFIYIACCLHFIYQLLRLSTRKILTRQTTRRGSKTGCPQTKRAYVFTKCIPNRYMAHRKGFREAIYYGIAWRRNHHLSLPVFTKISSKRPIANGCDAFAWRNQHLYVGSFISLRLLLFYSSVTHLPLSK